jgi:hypothetical protein
MEITLNGETGIAREIVHTSDANDNGQYYLELEDGDRIFTPYNFQKPNVGDIWIVFPSSLEGLFTKAQFQNHTNKKPIDIHPYDFAEMLDKAVTVAVVEKQGLVVGDIFEIEGVLYRRTITAPRTEGPHYIE